MNGANHQMNAASTYPFYIMQGWRQTSPAPEDLPLKGDTIICNDVWIGYDTVIMAGVKIGEEERFLTDWTPGAVCIYHIGNFL